MSTDTQITSSNQITDIEIQRENAAFEMLQRQAKMFASSSLVPKEFQSDIANCAIGINIAKRLGADPFMVLQNIDIIHGRPSFRATFLIAMVNASGRFEPLQFEMTETGKETTKPVTFEVWDNGKKVSREIKYTYTPTTCVAYARDKASGAVIKGPPVSYDMAITEGWVGKSGSKWQTEMRELMIRYRAAAFFARLYAPDITLGMMTAEEAQDVTERDVTPPPQATGSVLFKAVQAIEAPAIEAEPEQPFPQEQTALEKVNDLIQSSGVSWLQAMPILMRNKLADSDYETPEAAPEKLLIDAVKFWPSIVKLQKGGSK